MMIPLLGFVRGDCLGIIVLVDAEHTIAELALRAQRAAAVRVAPAARASVYRAGVRLSPELTVAAAGLTPLDRIDIVPISDAEDARA
jgi:hypothetical protein